VSGRRGLMLFAGQGAYAYPRGKYAVELQPFMYGDHRVRPHCCYLWFSATPHLTPAVPRASALARAAQVYPIGIPLLYAYILWKSRDSLNPRRAQATLQLESGGGSAMSGLSLSNESEDLKERIEKRADNPDLVPSMFLWKDYGEGRALCFSGFQPSPAMFGTNTIFVFL